MSSNRPYALGLHKVLIGILVTGAVFLWSQGMSQVTGIVASDSTGCVPMSVNFSPTGNTQNIDQYDWDFGNGSHSSVENPSIVYFTADHYTIRLITTDVNDNQDTLVADSLIKAVPEPIADFSVDSFDHCIANNQITFHDSSQYATQYTWDFGDGTISNQQNPTHSYTQTGNYTVTLIAENSLGCMDVYSTPQPIEVAPNPTASFSVDANSVCDSNYTFQFSDQSSGATDHLYHFGDGNSSTQANPSHSYGQTGSFDIQQVVTNTQGCKDTSLNTNGVTIQPLPTASFTMDTSQGCPPLTVTFQDTSPNSTGWNWDFGDGTNGTNASPDHTFQNPGTYIIELKVNNQYGCLSQQPFRDTVTVFPKPTASFSVDSLKGCFPHTTSFNNQSSNASSYTWDFDDGNTSTQSTPSHTYPTIGNYQVSLTAENAQGCTDTYTNSAPVEVLDCTPAFTADTLNDCAPHTVNFSDETQEAVQWNWSFGDGDSSAAENPSHTYDSAGTYTVTLVVTNSLGVTDTLVKQAHIQITTPAITVTNPVSDSGCLPMGVSLSDNNLGNNYWEWDMGDGTTLNGQHPNHTYSDTGEFQVMLTSETDQGCRFTVQYATFYVSSPHLDFSIQQDSCNPYFIGITDSSSQLASRQWNFGDGYVSNLENPAHIYSSPGIYSLTFTGTSPQGCTRMISTFIQVDTSLCSGGGSWNATDSAALDSAFGGSDWGTPDTSNYSTDTTTNSDPWSGVQACAPLTVQFQNPFPNAIGWHWKFGDGSDTWQENPEHTYQQSGTFDLTLITTYPGGVQDSIHVDELIDLDGHSSDFSIQANSTCNEVTYQFSGNASDTVSWDWDFGDGNIASGQNPTHTYPTSSNVYNVKLTTLDSHGCTHKTNKLVAPLPVDLTFDYDSTLCRGDQVNFQHQGSVSYSYQWNFGDGNTSTDITPLHTYPDSGTFDVSVTVNDTIGCTKTYDSMSITVNGVHAQGSISDNEICVGETVNLQAFYQGGNFYKWKIGNFKRWGTSNSITLNSPGTYPVKLIVKDNGCREDQYLDTILVREANADFVMSTNYSCFPVGVSFTDSSDQAVQWEWDFGDGNTSNDQNPYHSFTSQTNSDIQLKITDQYGCKDSITQPGVQPLQTDFSANQQSGCRPLQVQFSDQSNNSVDHTWFFGDGDTSHADNPTHVYDSIGDFDVQLVIVSSTGCVDTMHQSNFISISGINAGFQSTANISCAPTVATFTDTTLGAISWEWDFGDGTGSSQQHPTHLYNTPGNYTVSLVVENSDGCMDTMATDSSVVVLGPIADLTISDTLICLGTSIDFESHSTHYDSLRWNFGDGVATSTPDTSYTYSDTGTYSPSLIVQDTTGCMDAIQLQDEITILQNPIAEFSLSDTSGCAPLSISINNNSQYADKYTWDFGDGDTVYSSNPKPHDYKAGVYDLTLTVENLNGCADSSTVQITLDTPSVADFTVDTLAGCPPLQVQIDDQSTGTNSWSWDLPGGNSSQSPNPGNLNLTQTGSYQIQLITDNENGCADTSVSDSIHVHPVPEAGFTALPRKGCSPLEVDFQDTSSGNIQNREWILSNGDTMSGIDPTRIFGPGQYDVSLHVSNVHGCPSSQSQSEYIEVRDTFPPVSPKILRVSVKSDSSVVIDWEKVDTSAIDQLVLVGKSSLSSQFDTLSVFQPNATPSFIQDQLNTLDSIYCYKLQGIGPCGRSVPLDSLRTHCTINVEAMATGDTKVQVKWTPYQGCDVHQYRVLRAPKGSKSFNVIRLTADKTRKVTDTTALCAGGYVYRVQGLDLCGNPVNSWSDRSWAEPDGLEENEIRTEIIRSTVINNQEVLTEWERPPGGVFAVDQYLLYRRMDTSENFQLYQAIAPQNTSYVDQQVDVDNQNYYYKIEVISKCKIRTSTNSSSSIRLKGERQGQEVRLQWTPYEEWNEGVKEYKIQKKDEYGNWKTIKVVDGKETGTSLDD